MRKSKDFLLLFLKGVGMGGADIIPGVSGGTIAFITGIYEELLNSIKAFDIAALKLLRSGNLKAFWQHINGTFLLILASGVGLSLLTLVKFISYLLSHHPIQLWSFFFGLILISSIFIYQEVKKIDYRILIASLLGAMAAYFITKTSPASTPEAAWFLFVSGAIAICAMLLPGISGSFILLILGKYEFIIDALKELKLNLLSIFALGCITGLLSFSRLIAWLLKKYHNLTLALLAGFMLGSLNKIWPWKSVLTYQLNSDGKQIPVVEKNISPLQFQEVLGKDPLVLQALLWMGIGFLLVLIIEKLARGPRTAI
ncbi:MAG: DUF368 domain-containing protein [Cytophagales bacterium]|nr:DUF368 domain-containing protein [Cytophagales bacterium]